MSLKLKSFFKAIGIIFSLLLISSIIINILYYFDIISHDLTRYIKLSLSILSFFIGGVYLGKNSLNKAYLNGFKLSLIIIIIFLIFAIIFNNLRISRIIYYLIVLISITFGSMIGISNKENQ